MIKIKFTIISVVVALALIVGLVGSALASPLNWNADTSVALTDPSTTLTILSGSTADSVTIGTGSLNITMSSGQTFTLRSDSRKTLSHNSSALAVAPTCNSSYSQLVVTDYNTNSSNFLISVSDTACALNTGGTTGGSGGASGGTTTITTTTPTTTTPTTTTPTTTTPTTTTPATTTPATTVSYPDGTLLKSATDPKVYVVKNGEKVWIQTASEFTKAGYKWTDVKTVSADVIKQVGAVTLLRAEGDPRVYVVKNNIKRHITSPAEFASAGYSWSDVQVVAKSQVDAYPMATVITVKVVNTPTLRVRASNTTASGILGKVSQNETFTVLEEKNGWYKVTTKTGTTGWISGAYAVKQ